MPALQDRAVKNPDAERANHLHPRQRSTGKKPADKTSGVKNEAEPEQTRQRSEQIRQRRQMIKHRMQLMRLELPFLHEIHHPGYAGEGEPPIGDHRNGSVKFQPRIRRQLHLMRDIDRREKGEGLNSENERCRKRPHERETIGRSHQQIDERDRPGEKDEHFKQIGQRTTAQSVAAHGKKGGLAEETGADGKEIESPMECDLLTGREYRPDERRQITERRNYDQLPIHRPEL